MFNNLNQSKQNNPSKEKDFKICTWSYNPIKEYINIIQQKSELNKTALYLPKLINSFYTFKSNETSFA